MRNFSLKSKITLSRSISFFKNKFFTVKSFSINNDSMHVDHEDDLFFNKVKDWWDANGSMYTLHYYNDLRIKYIKRELHKESVIFSKDIHLDNSAFPFKGLEFLDIGCGAGLLCESIGRLGGNVVGIDSNSNSYEIASGHLNCYEGSELSYMKDKIKYFLGSIDNFKLEHKNENENKFDVVTAMEVIEHVNSPKMFIEDLSSFVKPGGYLIISTINKTQISYYTTILLAEKLTGIIPDGTHDWNKFITPDELIIILNENNYSVKNITGVTYNPVTSVMSLTDSLSINYILIAKKNSSI